MTRIILTTPPFPGLPNLVQRYPNSKSETRDLACSLKRHPLLTFFSVGRVYIGHGVAGRISGVGIFLGIFLGRVEGDWVGDGIPLVDIRQAALRDCLAARFVSNCWYG